VMGQVAREGLAEQRHLSGRFSSRCWARIFFGGSLGHQQPRASMWGSGLCFE
jgi:hypothetical protein